MLFLTLMKKQLLVIVLFFFCLAAAGQSIPADPPYKRFPSVPPLNLLLQDSASYFTKADLKKNKKTLIILFSPDCDHCQHEAKELVKHRDAFKDVQIVFSSTAPLHQLYEFYDRYELAKMHHVVVGKDYQYILPSFFQMKNFPFLALYNKKQELVKVFEGAYPVERIIEAFK